MEQIQSDDEAIRKVHIGQILDDDQRSGKDDGR
jgi:hypothetical protein